LLEVYSVVLANSSGNNEHIREGRHNNLGSSDNLYETLGYLVPGCSWRVSGIIQRHKNAPSEAGLGGIPQEEGSEEGSSVPLVHRL
jgi:hypothetical protein